MSQHDFNIANQGFPATRADINNAFEAIASNSSGPTAPSTTYANMWWYDTTNNKMYLRNEADSAWIEVATIDQSNNEWQITTGVVQAKDSDGLALKTDDGTTRLFIKDSDGAVGIGTSSPSATLDVSASTTNSQYAQFSSTNTRHLKLSSFDTASADAGHDINASSSNGVLSFSTDSTERIRIDANGNLGFNRTSANFTSGYGIHMHDNRFVGFGAGANGRPDYQIGTVSGTSLEFRCGNGADTADISIDASGNFMVGRTNVSGTDNVAGSYIYYEGGFVAQRDQNIALYLNRFNSDGQLAVFRREGTTKGAITISTSGANFHGVGVNNCGFAFLDDSRVSPVKNSTRTDNQVDLGTPTFRFDDIYATNATINTSDQNEKQQIASLTDAEMTAAKAISKLFKTFKWNDSVAEKGDAARTHSGVIAQEVEQAMTDAGLNAGDYAFFISTTWWETQTEVPAVEAADAVYETVIIPAVLDDDGNEVEPETTEQRLVSEAVEAHAAYTHIDTYETAEEAPEGATERNRKGIRYPQLLSFIGAATEQRLASIESRLDALEA